MHHGTVLEDSNKTLVLWCIVNVAIPRPLRNFGIAHNPGVMAHYPEARLSWKLVPISSMRMSKNTPSIILASSTGTFDFKTNICRLQKLTFCTKIWKSRWSKLLGELATMGRMVYWWQWWDAQGDMREDINFKGVNRESDFSLISILCPGDNQGWRHIMTIPDPNSNLNTWSSFDHVDQVDSQSCWWWS